MEITELPKSIGFFPKVIQTMSQNFKSIGQSILDLSCGNEKSKMAAGGHLGYRIMSKNNRLVPLGLLNMCSKFQVDTTRRSGLIARKPNGGRKKNNRNKNIRLPVLKNGMPN